MGSRQRSRSDSGLSHIGEHEQRVVGEVVVGVIKRPATEAFDPSLAVSNSSKVSGSTSSPA